MVVIPLQPTPAQIVSILLNNQACTFSIYQKNPAILTDCGSLYIDVSVGQKLIIAGVVCQNANRIVRDGYLGFSGDVAFIDTLEEGADPNYTGLGSRFIMVYLTPAELGGLG